MIFDEFKKYILKSLVKNRVKWLGMVAMWIQLKNWIN